MNASLALTVADTSVAQDAHGRFSLNDLHRASGGKSKHQPAFWMRMEQTQDLIKELANSAEVQSLEPEIAGIPAVSTVSGRSGGTFVVRELVYAYAMWISPVFHLKVIRAYDALVTSSSAAPDDRPKAAAVFSGVRLSVALMRQLGDCKAAGLARALYARLKLVDAQIGVDTPAIETIAPCVAQAALPGV